MRPLCGIAAIAAMALGAGLTRAATQSVFGMTPDGQVVKQYTLTNARGSKALVITLGATLRSLEVHDRNGKGIDVVLGYDTLEEYLDGRWYMGATVGRYANRIANAEFTIGGNTHRLSANNGANSLHGGVKGFNQAVWVAVGSQGSVPDSVRLKYVSPDGEEGYPGRLTVWVTYTLTNADELKIDYQAKSSATTVVNLTNHTYFNLGGAGDGEVLQERLLVAADAYTPANDDLIPTGQIRPVADTDYDFRAPAELGTRIATAGDPRVAASHGFDVNLVLRARGPRLHHAATLQDAKTGIELRLDTTEPGLQLFTPYFTQDAIRGKGGKGYAGSAAICLEPQHFPDSPHHRQFPSTVLRRGEIFRSESIYRFRALPLK
ncbi:MAG: galactose mutarotase [Pseudomonadota bacterium]|nr:galactose mutarotase [Pseudomonadota bacterium]